jgi:aspartate 1-decarboxylase
MLVSMLKSKVHRATITDANLNYVGSLTLDPILMQAAGFLQNEQVQVLNINNGSRLETYVIEGERGSGCVCLNGAAARLGEVGDLVIIVSYAWMDAAEAKSHVPQVVHVDAANRITN